jgi:hypothetical protein
VDASTVTLAVAGVAVVVGMVVAIDLIRARPQAAARARHPSTTPPLTITIARSGTTARWRVDLPPGRPPTTVDIVTYRPVDGSADWESEPIVDPIELRPGGWALLPSIVADPTAAYELVVGWTVRNPEADVTGSGRFVVDDANTLVARPAGGSGRQWLAVGIAILVLLAVVGGVVAWQLIDTDDDDDMVAVRLETSVGTAAATSVATTVAATEPPVSTSRPSTTSTSTSTTASSTTSTSTSSSTSTTPSTTSTSTSTSTPTDGPVVLIVGRVEDCRFGAQCLIAGFTIERFVDQPTQYTCEFSDGSTSSFNFGGDTVDTACSQAGLDPSITIEVDGIRSDTITRASVDET